MNHITNAVKIEVDGVSYHSFDDWELYITNTDYLGEPQLITNYVTIPGRSGMIDMSASIAGRPVYSHREINICFAGEKPKNAWDAEVSKLRNLLHGKLVKLTFDNDKGYYYSGRCFISDYGYAGNLGTFALKVPYAEPYKWDVNALGDRWKWDEFSFVDGEIPSTTTAITIAAGESKTLKVPDSTAPIVPSFIMTGYNNTGSIKVTNSSGTPIYIGEANKVYRDPKFVLTKNTTITVASNNGSAGTITILEYRRGLL